MSTQKRIIPSKLNYQNLEKVYMYVRIGLQSPAWRLKKVLPESENRSSKSDLSEREKSQYNNKQYFTCNRTI